VFLINLACVLDDDEQYADIEEDISGILLENPASSR
jgi:hypothetical protein